MIRSLRVGFVAVCLAVLAASPAAAARPAQDILRIDDIGIHDDGLSDLCGFDIWFDGNGHIVFRTFFDAAGNAIREVNNFGIRVRYYSENAEVSVVDVGPDRVTYNADGSLTVYITGNPQSIQVKGQGRVYSNVGWIQVHVTFDSEGNATGEVISTAGQHDDIDTALLLCELLG